MTATNPDADAPLPAEGVVQRLDRARGRLKTAARDAAADAQERLAPAVERAAEVADEARQRLQTVGRGAAVRAKRHPVATALALAGLGLGAFMLVRTPARTRALALAYSLWRSYGPRLRDLPQLGRTGLGRMRLAR